MASTIALRSLSLLAGAGLVRALSGGSEALPPAAPPVSENATGGMIGHFDLEVYAEGGCGREVSGVYRLKGMSELGTPFFVRPAPPHEFHQMNETNGAMPVDMFLFYAPCNGDPAPSAWFFAPMPPPPNVSPDFCEQLASSLSLPMDDAFSLNITTAAMWQSGACDTGASVSIMPLPSASDDLVVFGFWCHAGFNGLWKVAPESRMMERPMYYLESEDGLLVLMYREDLWECEDKNNKWSIWSKRDLDEGDNRCSPRAWNDIPETFRPMNGVWQEECEWGMSWAEVTAVPRTRTPWSSGCPESFGQYIGDNACFTYNPDMLCPYHCHRMLHVAEEVCSHTDMMWFWSYDPLEEWNATDNSGGSMVPILDHFYELREGCEPNEHCYSMLRELFTEEWHHCFDEICYEHGGASTTYPSWSSDFKYTSSYEPSWWSTSSEQGMHSSECMNKYNEALSACEGTDASIGIDDYGYFQNVFETLQDKHWCHDDHHDGECMIIPMHLAHRVGAVHC